MAIGGDWDGKDVIEDEMADTFTITSEEYRRSNDRLAFGVNVVHRVGSKLPNGAVPITPTAVAWIRRGVPAILVGIEESRILGVDFDEMLTNIESVESLDEIDFVVCSKSEVNHMDLSVVPVLPSEENDNEKTLRIPGIWRLHPSLAFANTKSEPIHITEALPFSNREVTDDAMAKWSWESESGALRVFCTYAFRNGMILPYEFFHSNCERLTQDSARARSECEYGEFVSEWPSLTGPF